jgi:hypothetical protein
MKTAIEQFSDLLMYESKVNKNIITQGKATQFIVKQAKAIVKANKLSPVGNKFFYTQRDGNTF